MQARDVQDHLRSLIGASVDRLPIDRVMGRIKILALVAIALAILIQSML